MFRPFLLLIISLFLIPLISNGQNTFFDYSVEMRTLSATDGSLPFWMYANNWGEIDPSSSNALLSTSVSREFFQESDRWDLRLGGELTARYSKDPSVFLKQLYTKLNYSIFQLNIGRFEDITGNVYENLSMGSMSFSGNATPIPKIKLSIPDYQPVPLTNGYLEIRGAWGHGWMEEERYVSNALLIEQYGYARLGGDLPINLIGGMQHFAFWGGKSRSFGPLPSSFNDFLIVAFATGEGGDDAPKGDQQYFLGDHKGYWDLGAEIDLKPITINLYKQFILEDKDNVKFKSPQDGLYGISIENKKGKYIEAFLWEFLYTKWQNGPVFDVPENGRGGVGGKDNYYNHYTYRSGWTYFGNTIGTPLLYPREDGMGIANNRVVAHHWGIEGGFSAIQSYQILFTYSRNYGTYNNPISPRKDSYSFLASTTFKPKQWKDLALNLQLAGDFGELYDQNVGLALGIIWQY